MFVKPRLVQVKMHSPDSSVLYEGEGRDATVKVSSIRV